MIQGSPNVTIGDSPTLMKASGLALPDLDFDRSRGTRKEAPEQSLDAPVADAELVAIEEETPKEVVKPKPELAPASVRIAINPTNPVYQDAQFILTSTDGSVTMTKTVIDDQKPGDNFLDLQFDDLDTSLNYTLEQVDSSGVKTTCFENFGHGSIGVQCPTPSNISDDEADNT